MATKTARGTNQDRALVAGKQTHEVAYEAKKSGAGAAAVREAVKKVGNARPKVEAALKTVAKNKR